MKNSLIATISTFLSHYFNPGFLKSGWLSEFPPSVKRDNAPEVIDRRVLEMKTRFLYCLKVAVRALVEHNEPFVALTAFEEDRVTETLEIISTPEHEFSDSLLNRCTEVMVTDISSVKLTEAICGQFLRRILQMVRQDIHDQEHIKYLYLFCVWKMPDVLFDPSISPVVRRREVRALLTHPRLPQDLITALRQVRGGGLFPASRDDGKLVDEGGVLAATQAVRPPPKQTAWQRLFSRPPKRKAR